MCPIGADSSDRESLRMLNRRLRDVGIRYEDVGDGEIVTEVKAMLADHHDIDKDKTLMVNFVALGASS